LRGEHAAGVFVADLDPVCIAAKEDAIALRARRCSNVMRKRRG
jgi:hypothetical protein